MPISGITFAFGWFLDKGNDGRPVWLGSVTFDRRVGLSHDTGQVTHRIGPDIDADRDLLMLDLQNAGMVQSLLQISEIGPKRCSAEIIRQFLLYRW